jgi:hypothetical protein
MTIEKTIKTDIKLYNKYLKIRRLLRKQYDTDIYLELNKILKKADILMDVILADVVNVEYNMSGEYEELTDTTYKLIYPQYEELTITLYKNAVVTIIRLFNDRVKKELTIKISQFLHTQSPE